MIFEIISYFLRTTFESLRLWVIFSCVDKLTVCSDESTIKYVDPKYAREFPIYKKDPDSEEFRNITLFLRYLSEWCSEDEIIVYLKYRLDRFEELTQMQFNQMVNSLERYLKHYNCSSINREITDKLVFRLKSNTEEIMSSLI